jgi:hypothetical protein
MSDLSAVVAGLFEKYDSDKEGTLSAPELEVFYNDLAASRPDLASGDYNEWFGAIDKDGDGKYNFEEFKSINRVYPSLLYPAFRLQRKIQDAFMGFEWWSRKKQLMVDSRALLKKVFNCISIYQKIGLSHFQEADYG